jgi:adenylosuccinate synthase
VVGITARPSRPGRGGPFLTELKCEIGERIQQEVRFRATTAQRRCGGSTCYRPPVVGSRNHGARVTKLAVLTGIVQLMICVGYRRRRIVSSASANRGLAAARPFTRR